MASLDDKLVGEKMHYYCSSSDDENDAKAGPSTSSVNDSISRPFTCGTLKQNPTTNTGPKGVLQDWEEFRQIANEKNKSEQRRLLREMQKRSLTARTYEEEAADKKDLDDLGEIDKDPVMQEYMKKRMHQILNEKNKSSRFGKVLNVNGAEFLDEIEIKDVIVICHLYEHNRPECDTLNKVLDVLANRHPFVKFLRMKSSTAGMSSQFGNFGVPALLAYKDSNLIGNFVCFHKELETTDFDADDVESFLIESGVLPENVSVIDDHYSSLRLGKLESSDSE